MNRRGSLGLFFVAVSAAWLFSGCSIIDKSNEYDRMLIENNYLRSRLSQLEEKDSGRQSELENAKRELEKKLRSQIENEQASLAMTRRGLVITFLDEIFFDSGKAEIRANGEETLNSVAQVLNSDVPDSRVAVEGHTDNVPIKHSPWASNWELSTARALSVLHFLIDTGGVMPGRLSAVGYGEYAPVADNDTVAGRQKNRRVEIVILPGEIKKIKK